MSLSILRPVKTAIQSAARRAGVHIISENRVPTGVVPGDFSAAEAAQYLRVRPWTVTTPERIVSLRRASEHVLRFGIEGDFAECGVWKGGSAMVMAEALASRPDAAGRRLWLYDVWRRTEWPAPVAADGATARDLWEKYQEKKNLDEPTLEIVRQNIRGCELQDDRVRYVVGRVEDTLPAQAPERIALLRIDTDFYESVSHAMRHLYPRLTPGGVLILDDYGCPAYPGAKRAVDEYLEENRIPLFLARLDTDGRIAIKP